MKDLVIEFCSCDFVSLKATMILPSSDFEWICCFNVLDRALIAQAISDLEVKVEWSHARRVFQLSTTASLHLRARRDRATSVLQGLAQRMGDSARIEWLKDDDATIELIVESEEPYSQDEEPNARAVVYLLEEFWYNYKICVLGLRDFVQASTVYARA